MNSSGSSEEQDIELVAATQERDGKLLITIKKIIKKKGNKVVSH